jgi:nonsense-mediated mRNA decay protein 3
MDLDAPVVALASAGTAQTGATSVSVQAKAVKSTLIMISNSILCCNCGAPIDGTTAANALCYDCIKLTVDISQGIPRESNIQFCRDCDRWHLPPTSWVVAAPESSQMLALCLKKLRGLNKVRVVDARFIWTEPNSRRVKVKITVQDSVAEGVVLQQSFEVVYIVSTQQCPECAKSYTANVWRACVQVRQKVLHKRTFLFLEQLILKHGAHKDTLNIKEAKDGIDFFFSARNQAQNFVDFLKGVVPVQVKNSSELISQDVHTSSKSMKFTYSVEILPICKDDLVALPISLAKKIGNISPLVLCYRIGTAANFLDPQTLQTAEVTAPVYWREKIPFNALADQPEQVEFLVHDIEPLGPRNGKWQLAEATVARADDPATEFYTRTHLGGLLQPGDSAMGYMLTGSNFNSPQLDEIEASHAHGSRVPDVVLVKKHWPNRRKHRNRKWRLKRMDKDEGLFEPKKGEAAKREEEYEAFLRDVEDDEELRAALALYKNTRKTKRAPAEESAMEVDAASVAETEDDGDDQGPEINMDELLDDLEELDIQDEEQ